MTRPDDPGVPPPYPFVPPEVVPPLVPERPERPGPPEHRPQFPPHVEVPQDDLRRRVQEQLMERRTVLLEGPLDGQAASLVGAQLMALDADELDDPAGPDRQVTLLVNSSGGPIDAVPAVLDTIDVMHGPVATTCIGQAVGTAAVVVAAGTGPRRAGPSALFRLRLPELELDGTINRLQDEVEQFRRTYDALLDRLAAVTGQERRLVARDVERGRLLPAEEAVGYGLVDEVIARQR